MKSLVFVLAAMVAAPVVAQEVVDRSSCLSFFADIVRISDGYQHSPQYHERILAEVPESASDNAKEIVQAHTEIAEIYRRITDQADLLCRHFE